MRISKTYLALALAVSVLFAGQAQAADHNVTADLAFDAALSFSNPVNIDFGILRSGTIGNYTIDTAGTRTVNSGEAIGGTPNAGSVTVSGSTTQTVHISTSGLGVAVSGVTLSAPTCNYDGAPINCAAGVGGLAAPDSGTTLLLGVTAAVDGSQNPGDTVSPTYTVTVVYG